MYQVTKKEKLFTGSFIFACTGNFLLFLGFYQLMPVLPIYLIDNFGIQSSQVGVILSSYTIAALIVRPFSGFLLDMFKRKPIYLTAYALFTLIFIGYPLAFSILMFTVLRVMHGMAFGMVTTAGNTIVVDIMPSSRRGEGLGYFGIANNIAMAVGPMIGIMLHDYFKSWDWVFYSALASGLAGFVFASLIKTPVKPKAIKEPISLDRFFLKNGIVAGLCLMLMAIPYGMTTTYISLFAKESNISANLGVFFSLMAVGLMISRTFSGKLVDSGKILQVIIGGTAVSFIAFIIFSLTGIFHAKIGNPVLLFYGVSILIGFGYGILFPAYNNLFINLAPHNRRATANSTYLTSWDVGIGIGLVLGGNVGQISSFSTAYLLGAVLIFISLLFFTFKAAPHFKRNQYKS
jgi:MFS family permease